MKTDPKYDKTFALTTRLSKMNKDTISIPETLKWEGGNITQTLNNSKIREHYKIYFKGFVNFNPGASKNQSTRLIDMANIGGVPPSTIFMVNLMAYTWTIHPINTINGHNKNR